MIEPFDQGLLDVGDGHRIHWEQCGDPAGKPAVVLHGGPGAGCGPWWRGLLHDPDPTVHERAAREWCAWEDAHVRVHPSQPPDPRYDDPAFRLCFARLVTHYWRHAAWLEDGALLRGAARLAGIPGVLVHGRLDVGSPLDIPWQLARAWRGSELVVVDEGHGGPALTAAVVAATGRLATAASRTSGARTARR